MFFKLTFYMLLRLCDLHAQFMVGLTSMRNKQPTCTSPSPISPMLVVYTKHMYHDYPIEFEPCMQSQESLS